MHQSSSLDFKLVQRVCLLQQALDQALAALQDLRSQVQDKEWIETQLANTEKYANVQQQAIAQLKQHLSQFTEVQHRLLDVTAYRLNTLIDYQQAEFNRLRIQIQQGQIELQSYLQYLGGHCSSENTSPDYYLALEAEVMMARTMAVSLSRQVNTAKQYLDSLASDLSNHHLNLSHIIKTLQAMGADLNTFEATADTSSATSAIALNSATANTAALNGRTTADSECLKADALNSEAEDVSLLQDSLRRQAQRIQELEALLMEQFGQRTQLKQRCQALAVEKDYYKRELEALKATQAQPPQQPEAATADMESPVFTDPTPHHRLRSQPHPPIQPLKLQEESE
ncbi:MAG: hypothetical protein AAFQ89_06610 [Cyanobacteria bacterium J06626_18]